MGKVAGQRVTFRASARVGAIAASLAAAAALLLPSTALAATAPIGSLWDSASTTFYCTPGADLVQSMGSVASYSVPPGGTSITQWSLQAGPSDGGSAALEVWRPTTTPTVYQLVGISLPETVTPGGLINADISASPIFVNSGDLLGLHVEGFVSCVFVTGTGLADLVGFGYGPTPDPNVNGTESLDQPGIGLALNVTATVNVTTPPNMVPKTANQCKGGGWKKLTDTAGTPFKNQGDCVSFVATAGTNLAAG
jgi:hypothetical protein